MSGLPGTEGRRLRLGRVWDRLRQRMARVLLPSVSLASICVGCLDPTPEYQAREPLPPVITHAYVRPKLNVVHVVYKDETTDSTVPLDVPFRAEDPEGNLRALLVLDQDPFVDIELLQRSNIVGTVAIPGSEVPFAQQSLRQLTFPWRVSSSSSTESVDSGCHSLTLVMTYSENIDDWGTCDQLICDPTLTASAT